MIINTSTKKGQEKGLFELNRLFEKQCLIELKEVKQIRTSVQHRALHLFFDMAANELNSLGIEFVYRGLKGMEMETRWTKELFKEFTWKPIQKAMYGTDSTRKLKRNEIDPIFEVINKFFAERGVSIQFPSQFEYYLKFFTHEHI